MGVLQVVLDLIVPVFGVLGIGYVLSLKAWFSEDAARGLAVYTIRIAIPIMLFRAMALADLPETFPLGFLASYFLAAYALFALGLGVAGRFFDFSLAKRGLFAFGCSYSNLILIGIPLVMTAWGDQAVLPLFSIVAVHTLVMFTPLTMILESDRSGHGDWIRNLRAAIVGLTRNQYIFGIILGLTWNLLGWPLPASLESVFGMFAASATPCALFCMGASLARYRIADEIGASCVITVLKVVLFPLVVWTLGTFVFEIDTLWLSVAVVISAMPTGINIYLFAEQYQTAIPMATTVTVLSTATSVITLTVVLTLLGVR